MTVTHSLITYKSLSVTVNA